MFVDIFTIELSLTRVIAEQHFLAVCTLNSASLKYLDILANSV